MTFLPGQIVFEGELAASRSHSLSNTHTRPRVPAASNHLHCQIKD